MDGYLIGLARERAMLYARVALSTPGHTLAKPLITFTTYFALEESVWQRGHGQVPGVNEWVTSECLHLCVLYDKLIYTPCER